jgi:hypothetical protein
MAGLGISAGTANAGGPLQAVTGPNLLRRHGYNP